MLKQLIQSEDMDEKRFTARGLAGIVGQMEKRRQVCLPISTPADNEAFANGKGQRMYALYQARLLALNACDFRRPFAFARA